MPRVLVVDDEEQIRHMLRKILTRAGHEVHTAGNVAEAIAACEPAGAFDVVISDIAMPGNDGHELARWLANQCPTSRVILMSGYDPGCDECPYRENCTRLSKPFAPQDVVALVSSVMAEPPRPRRESAY